MTHCDRLRRGKLEPPNSPVRLLVWALAAAAALALPADALANQVYKACGPKWLRKAGKLTAEQKSWLIEQRAAEHTVDIDGDGAADTIRMTSMPSFRDCEIRKNWNLKETTVRIEFGNGRTQLFYWINGGLAERMKIVPGIGRILVSGVDAEGRQLSKWVDYRRKARPRPETLVADRGRGEAAPGDRVASLGPQAVERTAAVLDK